MVQGVVMAPAESQKITVCADGPVVTATVDERTVAMSTDGRATLAPTTPSASTTQDSGSVFGPVIAAQLD